MTLNCKECKYYRKSNTLSGYCELWKIYIKENDGCDDGEEEENE